MPGSREASQARTQGGSMLFSMGPTEDDAWRSLIAGLAPPKRAGRTASSRSCRARPARPRRPLRRPPQAARQRLDVDLTLHLREHAAFLGPRRLAHELHVDTRLDRLVEAHLVQVDVRDVPADRILLVVLEDRRVCRRLSFEDDIEDRVKPSG